MTNIMSGVSMLLTNRFLLPYGSDKIADMGIAMKVNMISQMVMPTAPLLMGLFIGDAAVATAGTRMLRCMQIRAVFVGVTLATTSLCQSAGNGVGALALSLFRHGIVFVGMPAPLSALMGYGGILLTRRAAAGRRRALHGHAASTGGQDMGIVHSEVEFDAGHPWWPWACSTAYTSAARR